MSVVRRLSLLVTAGLLGIVVLLGWVGARPSISADSASQMAAGVSYFDSTIVLARNARPIGARGDALAIALGYLERERLGVASPFRLVDEALHDPRIDSATARRTGWALLGRLRRGDAYTIDAAVFDGVGPWSAEGRGAVGPAHVALIERAIQSAADPRVGELTVRLAYAIAAARGVIASNAPAIANEVAALVRDRALAEADLRGLLADAAASRQDPLALLDDRRSAGGFRVEQPALTPSSPAMRTDAMTAVPSMLAALDSLDRVPVAVSGSAPVLGLAFAARLTALGRARPTIAEVPITLRGHSAAKLDASNEETLVAAFAGRSAAPDSMRRAPALAMLSAGVALRTHNQDQPWFVGDAGPSPADVAAQFALGSISFARSVPAAWRPFYLRELQRALTDMTAVFGAASFVGLNVDFGTSPLPDSALAMHDPRSRALRLSIASSSGTIAHELAHDLDWQTARRLFADAGGYSTDRAMHDRRGALASSMRTLAEARWLRPATPGGGSSTAQDRPTEVFARSADWYVATQLALAGRTDGFLTAIQDAALPGYAAGAAPAVGFAAASSLVAAIDQMTYVSDTAQAAFESVWSDPATVDPLVVVRRVLSTPIGRVAPRSPGGPLLAPSAEVPLCAAMRGDEARARARLIALAIDARANGIVRRRARYHWGATRPDWASGVLGLPPYDGRDGAELVAAVRSALTAELRGAASSQGVIQAAPLSFFSSDANCSAISR